MTSAPRDYTLLESTVALCPECLARLDGKIIRRDDKVFIFRHCPEHGPQLDLLEEDAPYFLERSRFFKPATQSAAQTTVRKGCPFDCGLCPNHEQHSCIGLVEITSRCGQHCPVCFAGSGAGDLLGAEDFARMVDFAVATEGGALDVLQISGGEPTEHPLAADFIEMAPARGVKHVLLNTHGLNFARQPALVERLARIKSGFEVYLQFDGVSDEANLKLRGRPLLDAKLEALELLSRHEIPTTLVMTVAAGINDRELGAVVVKALETPFVRGVSFQTLAYFGRMPVRPVNRLERATVSGVIRRLEEQMKGMIRREHIGPLPCDPDRVAIGYFFRRSGGGFEPAATRADVEANLGRIENALRFTPGDFCAGSSCCGGLAGKIARRFPAAFFKMPTAGEQSRFISQNTFRITVTSFIDAYNFDLRSCQRECVHVITPDLRRIPFSAHNMVHRQHTAAA